VQALSFIEASALRGAILSLAYCVGLGAPFLVLALVIDKSRAIQSAIDFDWPVASNWALGNFYG
jgi:cytochrome c-type biogenesis protein